jgi:hypothetical protein
MYGEEDKFMKRELVRPRRRWKDGIKIDFQETG